MKILARLRLLAVGAAYLSLTGCATILAPGKPDLARLYESVSHNPAQPPVIVIHGLMGSTLVDARTGKQFWPGSLSTLAFSDYRQLARMSEEDRDGSGLVPGDLFYGIGGVDFYSALIDSLEKVGRFQRGRPGQPVGAERRRYYVLLYDWRRDNLQAVRQLHGLIEQIRLDYGDPKLRVDIIAHSNGGLIANYYLRYGPRDVLDQSEFAPWDEGGQRIRRVVLLGTPNLGAITSMERLLRGFRIALRVIPVEVLATFATPFETLPNPWVKAIFDPAGAPLDLDLYDPNTWRDRHWSVYSPDVEARVRASIDDPNEGERALAALQRTFAKNLGRARQFQLSLMAPYPASEVEVAVFGGDCQLTESRAMLLNDDDGERLVFRPSELGFLPAATKENGAAIDYGRLLLEPGDGLVTRASQVAQESEGSGYSSPQLNPIPIAQTFFLCERHGHLTGNPYFQNNLLYFLLAR